MTLNTALLCARCREPRVKQLPPDAISPHPAFVCEACGFRMRSGFMFFIYLVTAVLGLLFAGFMGIFFTFIAPEKPGQLNVIDCAKGLGLGAIGAIVAAYSIRQLFRPAPIRDRSNPPSTV